MMATMDVSWVLPPNLPDMMVAIDDEDFIV
jgi:hypothetical protein